tara:strand:+ start:265 stop:1425 length:1161 start_codon:yes stop_codon:yes gene_type:complete
MQFEKISVDQRVARANRAVDRVLNRALRSMDGVKSAVGLRGRKAPYDDLRYEFVGGPADTLRAKHYDKSLRLLWKAEDQAPWSSFRDCTPAERDMFQMALRFLTPAEAEARHRIAAPEFRALLQREYTRSERQAIVNILSAVGHGEAYAWLVSAELLGEVKSTGARAALTMQVLEEAKHFLVLRELLQAFEVPIPGQSAWEYMFMEGVLKAEGVEMFYGMNVLVEGIALSLFGLLSDLPGLEVLRLFHLDEARHTALPSNYLKEFPLTRWQSLNPVTSFQRLRMLLPALGIVARLEADMAELGLDSFQFGGALIRKISKLAYRNGFLLPLPRPALLKALNGAMNGYCKLTRANHRFTNFTEAETTPGARQLQVEDEIFAELASAAP